MHLIAYMFIITDARTYTLTHASNHRCAHKNAFRKLHDPTQTLYVKNDALILKTRMDTNTHARNDALIQAWTQKNKIHTRPLIP